MDAKIIEQGNGLDVRVGQVLVDTDGDTVTVVSLGRIQTAGSSGNWLMAEVELGGELSDAEALSQTVRVETWTRKAAARGE